MFFVARHTQNSKKFAQQALPCCDLTKNLVLSEFLFFSVLQDDFINAANDKA